LRSLSYSLVELSLLSSDREVLARSNQNRFVAAALPSEALAGVEEGELSTTPLTVINSPSEFPYYYEYC